MSLLLEKENFSENDKHASILKNNILREPFHDLEKYIAVLQQLACLLRVMD